MKIEVKNSKIKELPLKANVIHTTKSFNMEINDSIKCYQNDDDDDSYVETSPGWRDSIGFQKEYNTKKKYNHYTRYLN